MLEPRQLLPLDVADISAAFSLLRWNKPASQYDRYLNEAARGVSPHISFASAHITAHFRQPGVPTARRRPFRRYGCAQPVRAG
jgi:hypothetical protein